MAEGMEMSELAALVAELKVAAEDLRAGAAALAGGSSEGRDGEQSDDGVGAAPDVPASDPSTVGEEVSA